MQIRSQFELPFSNPVLVFFIILIIILLAPILLKRFNIPGIIGLIVAGVIIGPYGLNIIERNNAVVLFSTIGLLYIMFIAGLELDMHEFKSNRNKSILFGFFTFIIPMIIGFPVCYFILDYGFNASFLAASMFSTHTLVAYPIVSKLGVSKNQAVAITVGGTILTDTTVLIILAVIMGNSQGQLGSEFWIRLSISMTLFSVIMFYFLPKLIRWFLQKMTTESHAHYIFVLSVVFFSAFLTQIAGVEPIIGAFVAGLILNRFVPHTSTLMNRIEFIGNSLFIPVFLISVGMLVDVHVLFKGPKALIVAITLTVVALVGKWLAAFFTQKTFKYTKNQRQLIFGLSSSHAAATIAIILVGYNAGIIDENILNGIILLILVTCIVASLATDRASKKILKYDDSYVRESSHSYKFNNEHILLPIANEANIGNMLDFSLLIRDTKSSNPITMLSVVPNNREAEANILKSKKALEEFVKQGAANQVPVNPVTTIDHNPANGIERISREIMADIIIIGWPSKAGFFDNLIGDKLTAVYHNVDKNLMICHLNRPFISFSKIIVVSPSFAEKEYGFSIWVQKVARIAQELGLPVVHYGDQRTHAAIKNVIRNKKLSFIISFTEFSDWENFMAISNKINSKDLIIITLAREGSVSYHPILDSIPSVLENYFYQNSKIVIYPQQFTDSNTPDNFDSFTVGPFPKGLEVFGQIGKGIGSIFKKN